MFANINGVRIFYEKTGDGVPLILVHGNGENHKIFQEAVTVLCHDFTVYALDLRGHGRSSSIQEYHYKDMARDIECFIQTLGIDKPLYYGFSAGGIIGLLLASENTDLLSGLLVSGANLSPSGLTLLSRCCIRLLYYVKKDEKVKMMLTEPDISVQDLGKIVIPTLITAGRWDVIQKRHTKLIADHIRNSKCIILEKETHGSYIIHTRKIAQIIIDFCKSNNLIKV